MHLLVTGPKENFLHNTNFNQAWEDISSKFSQMTLEQSESFIT